MINSYSEYLEALREEKIELFRSLLKEIRGGKHGQEQRVQDFLEQHPDMIPLWDVWHNGLVGDAIITKFSLGGNFCTDFAYLSISSSNIRLHLVELECPSKKIFISNGGRTEFSSTFNHAYGQLESWRGYINRYKDSVMRDLDSFIKNYKRPNVDFRYTLIIGSSEEKNRTEERKARFSDKSTSEIQVHTFDHIIEQYKTSPYQGYLDSAPWILKRKTEGMLEAKYIPFSRSNPLEDYNSTELSLSERQIDILEKWGLSARNWKQQQDSRFVAATPFRSCKDLGGGHPVFRNIYDLPEKDWGYLQMIAGREGEQQIAPDPRNK